MDLLEVYHCPQFARPVVFAAKFKNVKNAGAVRQRIVKAATMAGPAGDKERDALNFAFVNARLASELSYNLLHDAAHPSRSDYQPTASADGCRTGALCRV